MKTDLFSPEAEGRARILMIISAFSEQPGEIVGWAKLFRLDFLVRYPDTLINILEKRKVSQRRLSQLDISGDIESRMIMYRWGPWDPLHYGYAAHLYSRGMIEANREKRGMIFRATPAGSALAGDLASHDDWEVLYQRALLARDYLNLSARKLTELIVDSKPSISTAKFGEEI
ncbi:hypothetical protein [Plesiocystis pacifica]|uniref:hypothetical protein n=1 Tax=Plesiocystis pacifica TaxID=191768 RepID=UPI0012F92280|nr:hypothetical protein [Plesiocystis pacifica]